MNIEAAYAARERDFARLKPMRGPSTLGEIWAAEWATSGLDTFDGVTGPMREARRELLQQMEGVTGKTLQQLEQETGVRVVGPGGEATASAAFMQMVGKLPEDQRKQLEPFADVIGNARRKAREIEQRAEEVSASTYGLSGYATAFMAGVSRQMVSPVNIAMIPVGPARLALGAGKGAVAAWLGKEALAGAVTQAVQEPFIAAGREQLGLQSSSLENIAQAAFGQAAFSGVLRAGAAGLRAWRQSEALRAQGLTRETAGLAAEIERGLDDLSPTASLLEAGAAPFPFGRAAPLDGAGRLVMDPPPLPELPAGTRFVDAPPRQDPVTLNARADVSFDTPPDLAGAMRALATRIEPEDIEAVALLAERNAVLDAQAEVLVRSLDNAALARLARLDPANVPADGRLFGKVSGETVADAAARLREAVAAWEKLDSGSPVAEYRAADNALDAANRALRDAAPVFRGDHNDLPISDFQKVQSRDYLPGELGNIIQRDLPKATDPAERARLEARAAEIIDILDRPLISPEEVVSRSADAIDQAARALEAGRSLPEPPAGLFVRPEVVFSQPGTRWGRLASARPDLTDAVARTIAAIDAERALPDTMPAPERMRLALAEIAPEARITGDSPFGPVIAGLDGRADTAIQILMRARTGIVPGVLPHPLLPEGPAGLVFGRVRSGRKAKGFGLVHISEERGRPIVAAELVRIWPLLNRREVKGAGERIELTGDPHGVGVSFLREENGPLIMTGWKAPRPDGDTVTSTITEEATGSSSPRPGSTVSQTSEAASNALRRAMFADDAMTVPLPRDLAIDRITRAAERALSAEAVGAPAWSIEGIARLAQRIDAPVSDRGLPRSALLEPPNPGTARVRTRVKVEPGPGGATLDMRTQRVINTVTRELEAAGDLRVDLDGPDGRRVTSAREMVARIADDEQALAALDACVTGSAGGDA